MRGSPVIILCYKKVNKYTKKIKPVALAIIKLRLSEGISQLLSQLIERAVSGMIKE